MSWGAPDVGWDGDLIPTAQARPWPTVADVAAALRRPLESFTDLEAGQLARFLASATAEARIVPELRAAAEVPDNVANAIIGLTILDYRLANPSPSSADLDASPQSPGSARWQYLMAMGRGRGGRPRVG